MLLRVTEYPAHMAAAEDEAAEYSLGNFFPGHREEIIPSQYDYKYEFWQTSVGIDWVSLAD